MTMRVLVVCSSFPPVNATGVHRTLALIRRLAAGGHGVTVLTMPPQAGQNVDPFLARRIPAGVRVLRARPFSFARKRQGDPPPACPKAPKVPSPRRRRCCGADRSRSAARGWLADWLKVPDSRIGWLVPAVWRAVRSVRRAGCDVIYTTAPMWTAHLVGLWLSRLLGRPWVADCRDPWRANPFRVFRHGAHGRVDAWLEARVLAAAAFVICNTDPARDEMAYRYPGFAGKLVAIANGYDSDEVEAVRQSSAGDGDGLCRFAHAGSFYGPRSPLPLMRALKSVVDRRPEVRSRVRFCQIGPDDYEGTSLSSLAERLGIADVVETTGPLPHAEALRRVNGAAVAVVCGHSGPGADLQIPRKFYEYVGLRRPILVIGGVSRAIARLMGERNVPSLWLVDDAGPADRRLSRALERIVLLWRDGRPLPECRVGVDLCANRMAERIEALLERAARSHARLTRPRGAVKEAPAC